MGKRKGCAVLLPAIALCLIFSVLLSSGPVFAAEGKKVSIRANKRAVYDTKKDIFTIEGDVRIAYDDLVIEADKAEFDNSDKNNEMARIEGNVRLTQDKTKVRSNRLEINLDKDTAVFDGDVFMEKDEKNEDGTEGDRLTLKCGKLIYDTKSKSVVAEGGVQVIENDTKAFADRVEYDDEKKVIKLFGNVVIEEADGEVIKCNQAVIDTEADRFDAEGDILIEFTVDEEE